MKEPEPEKKRTFAPWIKWTIGLPWKPEVMKIAAAIGKSRREVACMCMELWEWCDRNANEDGCCAPSVTVVHFNELVSCAGFAEAMIDAGWLLKDDGGLIFPNYDRHNGNNAKKRAQAQRRMQALRN